MKYELIALGLARQETQWLRSLLGNVPLWGTSIPIFIHCNSQATIGIVKNSVYNDKRRHICLRHGDVKQMLKGGVIS